MKRFWEAARIVEDPRGWSVLLDDRPVRTPAKCACIVPTKTIAEAIAQEWDAQEGEIRPLEMPMTRAVATCLDRVAPEIDAVRATVAAYGGTDLLCYRAEHPPELARRQSAGWDPLLGWAEAAFGARLILTAGVMPVTQPPESVQSLAAAVDRHDAWELTALAEMTTISGSLVLALAVTAGRLDPAEAWALSRIDEAWNIEQWGEDAEAAAQTARREADFHRAARFLELLMQR